MAGFYPDVPAPRMAYDIDGTVLFHSNLVNTPTQITGATLTSFNDETSGTGLGTTNWIILIFPQLRNVSGVLFRQGSVGGATCTLQSSPDTTNGNDGTWTTASSAIPMQFTGGTEHRSSIRPVTATSVKAIRIHANNIGGDTNIYNLHVYGNIDTGQTPDRLRAWHPTLDEPLDDNTAADGAWLDWGDATRGTTADKTFRIKNNSATQTANSISIASQVLTDTTPNIGPQITYSDGGAFATSLNIGNLAPGAISSVITVRRTTPTNASVSVWTWRSNIVVGSWL